MPITQATCTLYSCLKQGYLEGSREHAAVCAQHWSSAGCCTSCREQQRSCFSASAAVSCFASDLGQSPPLHALGLVSVGSIPAASVLWVCSSAWLWLGCACREPGVSGGCHGQLTARPWACQEAFPSPQLVLLLWQRWEPPGLAQQEDAELTLFRRGSYMCAGAEAGEGTVRCLLHLDIIAIIEQSLQICPAGPADGGKVQPKRLSLCTES